MRVGIVADVHVGNHRVHGGLVEAGLNRRAREVADVLRRAVEAALDQGCKRLVIAGDLFDVSRPSPQLIRLVQEALDRRPGVTLPTYVLAGNHDIESMVPGDNALGPLKAIPNVHVAERPSAHALDRGVLLLVPFRPGNAREWLPDVLRDVASSTSQVPDFGRVLVTHLGIVDENTQPFLRDAHDAVELEALRGLCRAEGVGHVYAGNWHEGKSWPSAQVAVVQVGTLAPTGWDNPGMRGYGSLWIHDEAGPTWGPVEIPGPRFFTILDADQLLVMEAYQQEGHHVYVRWLVGPGESVAEAQAELDARVAAGKITAGEASEDKGDATAMARVAAKAAAEGARGAAEGLDAVLAAFVEHMSLPEGVDRSAVLAEAKRFLAAG